MLIRGGVEDTWLEAKDKPKTTLSKTDPLEAKDRNVRGQGQRPRTQEQVFYKKKFFKFFLSDLQKKSSKNVFR